MKNERNTKLIRLKNWLLTTPVLFTVSFFLLSAVLCLGYALIQTVFNIETIKPVFGLLILSFIVCTWYTIKKLPHDKMNQNDFIAITNASMLISIVASFIMLFVAFFYGTNSSYNLMMIYLAHKTLITILFLLFSVFSVYLIGLTICNIYAKYKRATSIGITPWKVILSMPFAFLLMWTPGYLIKGKDIKSNLQIKSGWYTRLQKWVMTNSANILFTFLFLVLFRGIITGLATFVLYASLLVIYALWYTKYKSDFMKNINGGYAMTTIGINIAIILAIIVQML